MELQLEYALKTEPQDGSPEGSLFQFETEIERLENVISTLDLKLAPVLSLYATVQGAGVPEAEPQSNLHGKVRRLESQTNRLVDIMERIAL